MVRCIEQPVLSTTHPPPSPFIKWAWHVADPKPGQTLHETTNTRGGVMFSSIFIN